jgi:carotenoid cleavage dioxygenase-like enzyme
MLGISKAGRPGRKFFDHVVRVDWPAEQVEVYAAPAGSYFGGEPCFVPDPAAPSSRGVVVCQQFDAGRRVSMFVAFDAFALGSGPIARITLPDAIPLLFHSAFYAERRSGAH